MNGDLTRFLQSPQMQEILNQPGFRRWVVHRDPVAWLQAHFYIRNPRDPETGAELGRSGRIKVAEYQQPILREALRRERDGKLRYSTVVWSEPKKSAKSTLAAGVGLYVGHTNDFASIYCLANDGRQSRDREYLFIRRAIELSAKQGGLFAGIKPGTTSVDLANGSIIQAVAVDPSGEAGGEPLMTIWGEMHGYKQAAKLRLFAEMTIPPTLYGYAQRWVESYAGYEGESPILEQLYQTGVTEGEPHPMLPDCYVNQDAAQFTFWSHTGRFPWHTQEYYDQEQAQLTSEEFRRIHKNEWVSSKQTFVTKDDWKACLNPRMAALDEHTPIIVALDGSVSGDSFAIVAVSGHPSAADKYQARLAVVLRPELEGGRIDQSRSVYPVLRHIQENFNVLAWVYDPYQLHKLATDLRSEGWGLWLEFPQATLRLVADTFLRQMIAEQRIEHDGDPDLTEHIENAAAVPSGTDKRSIRLMKKTDLKQIDAAVALSMALFAMSLTVEHGSDVLYMDELRVTVPL